MPCYTPPDQGDKMQIAELETMLCGLCRRVEFMDVRRVLIEPDPTLVTWWTHHKAIDDRRVAVDASNAERAKLAKRAKAKLTVAEREALGIRD